MIAKLVNITPISLWFMVPTTIVNGVYQPTNITGGPHIVQRGGDLMELEFSINKTSGSFMVIRER